MRIRWLIISLSITIFFPVVRAQNNALTINDSIVLYEKLVKCLQKDILYNAEQKEEKFVNALVQKTNSLLSSPYNVIAISQQEIEIDGLLDSSIVFTSSQQMLQKSLESLQTYTQEWAKMDSIYVVRDSIVMERLSRLNNNSNSTLIKIFVSDRLIPYRDTTEWSSFKESSIPYIREVYERKEQQTQQVLNASEANYLMLLTLLDLRK